MVLRGKSILLVISGGIAAYKSLELIRALRKEGAAVRAILTAGGAQFVTPLSVAALTENPVYSELWSLKDETEMGHIRLSREADLIVVAPASANILAQMAHGLAADLATTTLLAATAPVLIAPAMNHVMWNNPATQANIRTLLSRGVLMTGPGEGDMACGEYGPGRMSEPLEILESIIGFFQKDKPLSGKTAIVTSGPTFEPLDPVRFIGNRSSGKQGHAVAQALADAGAAVTLVCGPVSIPDPSGVHILHVETALQMHDAALAALPADIAVCAAAVSDWMPEKTAPAKIKKTAKGAPSFSLTQTPDILKALATHRHRPALVIGFAAETENLLENSAKKLASKKCDAILVNDVSGGRGFNHDDNTVTLLHARGSEEWAQMSKTAIAKNLVRFIMDRIHATPIKHAAE